MKRGSTRPDPPPPSRLSEWAVGWAAAQGHPLGRDVTWRETTGGAWLGFGIDDVVKVHPVRTDQNALSARVEAAAAVPLRPWLVAPLTTTLGSLPGEHRLVTLWPRVSVLDPDEDEQLPWASIGAHLAGLHRVSPTTGLPHHGGVARVERALYRPALRLPMMRALGERLVRELAEGPARHTGLVHGDWHLGQLARMPQGWRLLDVDDLGMGDAAWDLGRPAGFWATGVLGDADWAAFLAGYRAAGGPAVPPAGDPWPTLDLPARCAVFVAACRELRQTHSGHSGSTAEALIRACERM